MADSPHLHPNTLTNPQKSKSHSISKVLRVHKAHKNQLPLIKKSRDKRNHPLRSRGTVFNNSLSTQTHEETDKKEQHMNDIACLNSLKITSRYASSDEWRYKEYVTGQNLHNLSVSPKLANEQNAVSNDKMLIEDSKGQENDAVKSIFRRDEFRAHCRSVQNKYKKKMFMKQEKMVEKEIVKENLNKFVEYRMKQSTPTPKVKFANS